MILCDGCIWLSVAEGTKDGMPCMISACGKNRIVIDEDTGNGTGRPKWCPGNESKEDMDRICAMTGKHSEIPAICRNCCNLDWDWSEYTDMTGYYCRLCLVFPTKESCKRHNQMKGMGNGRSECNDH